MSAVKLENKKWQARIDTVEENFVVVRNVCVVMLTADCPRYRKTGVIFREIDIELLQCAPSPWHYLANELEGAFGSAEANLLTWMELNPP